MSRAMLAVKFRNRIHAIDPNLDVHVSNVIINGVKRGCWGYVTDPSTGRRVEINTDVLTFIGERDHSAYAREIRDGKTGRNNWCEEADLPAVAHQLLTAPIRPWF